MSSVTPAQMLAQVAIDADIIASNNPTSTAWLVRVGRLIEDGVDNMVAMSDSGGFTPNTKWLLDFPTVQALVRGAKDDYSGGFSKAQEIRDVLLGLEPQDVLGEHISGITMLSDITSIGYDQQSRPIFSVNFRVLLERVPNALTNREALG